MGGGGALPPAVWCCVARRSTRRELSNLLIFSAYNIKTAYTSNGASKLSTCTNCKACSNGSVTGSGDHGISGTITNLSPCVDLQTAEGARKADSSLPAL